MLFRSLPAIGGGERRSVGSHNWEEREGRMPRRRKETCAVSPPLEIDEAREVGSGARRTAAGDTEMKCQAPNADFIPF